MELCWVVYIPVLLSSVVSFHLAVETTSEMTQTVFGEGGRGEGRALYSIDYLLQSSSVLCWLMLTQKCCFFFFTMTEKIVITAIYLVVLTWEPLWHVCLPLSDWKSSFFWFLIAMKRSETVTEIAVSFWDRPQKASRSKYSVRNWRTDSMVAADCAPTWFYVVWFRCFWFRLAFWFYTQMQSGLRRLREIKPTPSVLR